MKKVIKIAHLYYDLLNLYGEVGNVKALEEFCKRAGAEVEVHFLTIGDKIDFKKYDFYYIGEGSEESQELVLEDIKKYKDSIKAAIDDGKFFLATGNAMEYFGKKIRKNTGISLECLDIFSYVAFEEDQRLVSEIIYDYDKLPTDKGRKFLGFKNCNCNIRNNDQNRMFKYSDSYEYKNFYGMNFVGPALIRNPYFTNYIVKKLFESKNYDYTKLPEDTDEFKAYDIFLDNFVKHQKEEEK